MLDFFTLFALRVYQNNTLFDESMQIRSFLRTTLRQFVSKKNPKICLNNATILNKLQRSNSTAHRNEMEEKLVFYKFYSWNEKKEVISSR